MTKLCRGNPDAEKYSFSRFSQLELTANLISFGTPIENIGKHPSPRVLRHDRSNTLRRFRSSIAFSAIRLSSLVNHLPKLTVRSETYDPWDPNCDEAPKGVVPSHHQSKRAGKRRELAVRASLAARDDARTQDQCSVAEAGSAKGNATPMGLDGQTNPSDMSAVLLRPNEDGAALHLDKDVSARVAVSSSTVRHHSNAQPGNFGEWLSRKLPKLPGSPSQLRNSLPLWLVLSPPGKPDKRRLMTVQDFFKHAEDESRAFFQELDSDGDGKVTTEDVKRALRERNLPESRARDLMSAARAGRWWQRAIEWEDLQAVVEEREPKILRAYTAMPVDAQGQLQSAAIQRTLSKLGMAATEENAKAMIRALGGDQDGTVTYDRFRRFALLLPEEQVAVMDPGRAWFEAASIMPLGRPADIPEEQRKRDPSYPLMLAKAALAGGLASSVSVLLLHPIDTLKTRLQSTAGATLGSMARAAPTIGVRGLYRGIIPAVGGSFVSHGMRTLSYEAAATGLQQALGQAFDIQVQGLASGVGTVFGTCIRIPCEVMKQRLQVGRHANTWEAARAATATEGLSGLFRGTAALLGREVPFYMLGMVAYQQLKKAASGGTWRDHPRELANWQYILIGGLAGAMASVATMPMDVCKTRIMTAAAGSATPPIGTLLVNIVKQEGVGALYKGALPRALWVAPVGAMNFAGYELAKRALSGPEQEHAEEAALVSPAH